MKARTARPAMMQASTINVSNFLGVSPETADFTVSLLDRFGNAITTGSSTVWMTSSSPPQAQLILLSGPPTDDVGVPPEVPLFQRKYHGRMIPGVQVNGSIG